MYLWGANIDGQTRRGQDVEITFADILDNLNMAFMGTVQARKGKWSATVDAMYMKLSKDFTLLQFENASIEQKAWVLNLNLARTLYDKDCFRLDVLAGTRYLSIDTEIDFTAPVAGTSTISDNIWDFIAGVKGEYFFYKSWFIPYYLDLGIGGSEFTWQGIAGVGYGFTMVEVVIAYRYMEWSFGSDKPFDNLHFQGPLLGAAIKF